MATIRIVALALGIAAVISPPVVRVGAQPAELKEQCLKGYQLSHAKRIEVCTAWIESGHLSDSDLAAALAERGEANFQYTADKSTPDFADVAIGDLTKAIHIDPKNAEYFEERSSVWRTRNNFENAIADANAAIRLDPKSGSALLARAMAYLSRGDFDRAIADIDAARQLKSEFYGMDEAIRNAAVKFKDFKRNPPSDKLNIYGFGVSSRDVKGNDPMILCGTGGDKSVNACNDVTGDSNRSAADRGVAYINLAQETAAGGGYSLASIYFTKAINLLADPHVAYNLRGQTYGMMGARFYNEAIADFTKAIELTPTYAPAFFNRGQTRVAIEQVDGAISDFDAAIKINPSYAMAFDARGNAFILKKDYNRARKDFDEALRLEPDYAAAYHDRGRIQPDKTNALRDLSRAIDIQPRAVDFRLSRALFTAMQGDNDLAIADLNDALRFAPDHADLYLIRGNGWIGLNDGGRAMQDFDKAIALDPQNSANVGAMAWSLKGQLYYLRGNFDAAAQSYDKAVGLAPKEVQFHVSRGLTYAARGELERAIQDYTQALTLEPAARAANFARGLAYFGQGSFPLAAEDFAQTKSDPKDLHGLLWFYLANARAGSTEGRQDLANVVAQRKSDAWPIPVFQLLLGQRTPETVLAAAQAARQRCEAQFYSGEWQMLQGARKPAADAWTAAAKSCPPNAIEYQVAMQELKRLGH